MRKHAARTVIRSIAAALVVACALVLGGCSGENPEDAIRADIVANFDQIKNLDEATLEEISSGMDVEALEPFGLEGDEIVRSLLDGFDYSVESVSVDDSGESATAEVSVTCKSATDLTESSEDAVASIFQEPDYLSLLGDDEALGARMGELMMGALDGLTPSEKSIELDYAKGKDGWEMDASSSSEITKIFL